MPKRSDEENRISSYGKFGIVVSILIFALSLIYVISEWPEIRALEPNEFGDLLAGILGPLALLWLVLGFFQQGEELRQSVRALELQSEELRNSVEQQAALVEVTREQAQAELAALNEERDARRAASAPRFTVHASGGGRSGNLISQKLNFHNVGAIASDVRVIVEGDVDIVIDRFWSVWGGGEREAMQFDYQINDRPSELTINIVCKDRFGQDVSQTIALAEDPENLTRYVPKEAAQNS